MSQPRTIKLRPLLEYNPETVELYARWFAQPELVEQIAPFGGLPGNATELEEWLKSLADNNQEKRFLVEHEGQPAGEAGLLNIGQEEAALSVFIADPALRGQGIGREAVRQIIALAFGELNLGRLYLATDSGNNPAVKTFKSLGFTEIASADLNDNAGKPRHEILMELWNTAPMLWKLNISG